MRIHIRDSFSNKLLASNILEDLQVIYNISSIGNLMVTVIEPINKSYKRVGLLNKFGKLTVTDLKERNLKIAGFPDYKNPSSYTILTSKGIDYYRSRLKAKKVIEDKMMELSMQLEAINKEISSFCVGE